MSTKNGPLKDELVAAYDEAVRQERGAWAYLKSLAPGDPKSADAMTDWRAAAKRVATLAKKLQESSRG